MNEFLSQFDYIAKDARIPWAKIGGIFDQRRPAREFKVALPLEGIEH